MKGLRKPNPPASVPPLPIRRPRYTAADRKKVVDLYKAGYSIDRISRMDGMPSYKTVMGILKEAGVERRSQAVFDRDAIRRDVIKLRNHTLKQIADIHGCSIRLVSVVRATIKHEQYQKELAARRGN